jgi:hypothetical protein
MIKNSSLIIVLVFGAISFSQAQREVVVLISTIHFVDGRISFPTSILHKWEDRKLLSI